MVGFVYSTIYIFKYLKQNRMKIRVGFGYDVHAFATERELWLGGVKVDHKIGLLGHSDADVLIHALCDALLGAANLRDIGYNFPDTDGAYKNIDSKILLSRTMDLIRSKGYEFGNADCTICAQEPKLNSYIPKMQRVLSDVMGVSIDDISIKATTTEKLGFVGKKQGMEAFATVLVERK